MNTTRIRTLAHKLGKPLDGTKPSSDPELLARFLDGHDEIAFEELVTRHLPAVRAVCRSVLRDPNDADDAAQATFLVLVRRSAAVRNRLALGAWLCRVAWRTANRLREANARRAATRAPDVDPDATPAREVPASPGEVIIALEDEIRRLPEKYRTAVMTCYGTGVPTAEAAKRLGWPKGTLLTRLAWARKRLRDRLSRRGVTLPGSLAGILAGHSSRAADAILVCRYAAAGMAIATGDPVVKELTSERVLTLTEGTVRAMIGTQMKMVLGIGFLVAAILGLGLGRLTLGSADAAPGEKKTATAPVAGTGSGAVPEGTSGKETRGANEPATDKRELALPVPGNELFVRRPLGSFTREVPGFGKATVTFTENRIHLLATVRIDKTSFSVAADADYSMNQESMVYGIITGVDVIGAFDGEEAAELMALAAAASDLPFAFRVRVEDDAIMIKDVKCGPFGSPIFTGLLGGGKNVKDETMLITGIVCGKYKADPNPDRNPSPPTVKPKKK